MKRRISSLARWFLVWIAATLGFVLNLPLAWVCSDDSCAVAFLPFIRIPADAPFWVFFLAPWLVGFAVGLFVMWLLRVAQPQRSSVASLESGRTESDRRRRRLDWRPLPVMRLLLTWTIAIFSFVFGVLGMCNSDLCIPLYLWLFLFPDATGVLFFIVPWIQGFLIGWLVYWLLGKALPTPSPTDDNA